VPNDDVGVCLQQRINRIIKYLCKVKGKGACNSLRSESPPQKRSGMARVLNGFHTFACTPTGSSAMGMSFTYLCLPSRSWYSFTNPGRMEGWV